MTAPEPQPVRPPHRRWLQTSRRWSPLLAVVIAVPCCWFAVTMDQAQKQQVAVEEIENVGGVVWFDYQFDRAGSEIPDAEMPGEWWARRLLGNDFFTNVTKLDLAQTEIGDEGLKYLSWLSRLQSVSLGERVTDAGLAHLKGLTELRWLDLRKTRVTDAAIRDLQKALPHCTITARK
jgi:hypothetical protein